MYPEVNGLKPAPQSALICNISSILFFVIRKYTLVFEQGNEKSSGPIFTMLRVLEMKIHFSQKLFKKFHYGLLCI